MLPEHETIFAKLLGSLKGSGNFAVMSGPQGVGKIAFCLKLLSTLELHTSRYKTLHLARPPMDTSACMQQISAALGNTNESGSLDPIRGISSALVDAYQAGKHVIIIMDDAHALSEEVLEDMYLLARTSTDSEFKLLVLLVGQPELNATLKQEQLAQIGSRLLFNSELTPLSPEATRNYINYRLKKAGHTGPEVFTGEAIEQLHALSQGSPRIINSLCHSALLAAASVNSDLVEASHLQTVNNQKSGQ